MTSRERVRTSFSRREPDRVPVDLGGWQSGISHEAYGPLIDSLTAEGGAAAKPESRAAVRMSERVQGLVQVGEPGLETFGVDTRYVFPNNDAASCSLRGKDHFADAWGIGCLGHRMPGAQDAWGTGWIRPVSSHYYDIERSPLAGATLGGISRHQWSTAGSFIGTDSVKTRLAVLLKSGRAVFTCLAGVFEQATYLRGMAEFYADFVLNPAKVEALMDKVLEVEMEIYGRFFEMTGGELDLVQFWGDLGSQRGLLISPEHYRRYVKPREAALVEFTKKRTRARVCLHSCGSVYAFIPDVIDAGYEVLNPVQTTAAGMDPFKLKKEFGGELAFQGAVDTQRVLTFGSVEEVRENVKRMIESLAPGGGYILAPCHNIQASTSPDNVAALFEAATSFGSYPVT